MPGKTHPHKIDIDRYVPALVAWIAQDLVRGSSNTYLRVADVGMESWRCLLCLAVRDSISAQWICEEMKMDKSSVSTALKELHAQELIVLVDSPTDRRSRLASLTRKGRAVYEKLYPIAMERQRTLLSELKPSEVEVLLDLLNRLRSRLPAVEEATERYVERAFGNSPKAPRQKAVPPAKPPLAPGSRPARRRAA